MSKQECVYALQANSPGSWKIQCKRRGVGGKKGEGQVTEEREYDVFKKK